MSKQALSNPPAHLSAEAAGVLDLPTEQRVALLAQDRWVDYPRARQALQELERLLKSPRRTRMPGLLLHGESNMGKSMIIQKFLRAHPTPAFDFERGVQPRDILALEMPAAPTQRRLYGQILLALNAPYRPSDRLASVEFTALSLLRQVGPKIIVVDEVHNLLAGSAREQRAALNSLKFLANQLPCAIVAVGTRDALAAVRTDAQIESRLPALELPRWHESDALRSFIAGLERQLPLRLPSQLANNRALVSALLNATGGLTGALTGLLARAAERAILGGSECITPAVLKKTLEQPHF